MRASRISLRSPWLAMLASLAVSGAVAAPSGAKGPSPRTANGFNLEGSAIPADEILRGGPPRDGIPALWKPEAVPASKSPWGSREMVIGVAWEGGARAYPLSILVWHELVNDTIGGRPILVSYCPLCGTGLVFDRRVSGQTRRFGVSGLLYRSDLLMYDHETESLWSQIRGRAATGPARGGKLTLVRSRMERWGSWKRAHPETTILSRNTGFQRSYDRSPYGDYDQSERLYFPAPRDPRYHPKMPTIGLRTADRARAYPADELRRAGGRVEEEFADYAVTITYDLNTGVFRVEAPQEVEVVEGYWFAWAAFHPETSVFRAPAGM